LVKSHAIAGLDISAQPQHVATDANNATRHLHAETRPGNRGRQGRAWNDPGHLHPGNAPICTWFASFPWLSAGRSWRMSRSARAVATLPPSCLTAPAR